MLANPLRRSPDNRVIESPYRLKIGLERFADRPAVQAVILPVCGDELLNPVRVTNIGPGLFVEVGTIVDLENGLEALSRRHFFRGDATNVIPQQHPNCFLRGGHIHIEVTQGLLKQGTRFSHDKPTSRSELADRRRIHALSKEGIGNSRQLLACNVPENVARRREFEILTALGHLGA